MTSEGADVVAVSLLDVPVRLWGRLDGEWKDLMREFALISLADNDGDRSSVPSRLLELVDELQLRYGSLGEEQLRLLEEAHSDGVEILERLDYLLPRHVGPDIVELARMMQEADAFCAEGEYLLSLASSPASRALRGWIFDELCVQLDGGPPTPWRSSRFAGPVREVGDK